MNDNPQHDDKSLYSSKSTNVRIMEDNADYFILDVRDGVKGSIGDWMAAFCDVWSNPGDKLERLLGLLSDDIVLKASTIPPVSRGKEEARAAFKGSLRAMPDLSAYVHNWSYTNDVLFIEMTFSARIGRKEVSWRSIDRFLFKDGVAVERINFFDPTRVRRAFLFSFSGFRQYLRMLWG